MAMRDIIKKSILEGGATRESLLKLTGTTEKGLASQFTYLRMMGSCPKKQEDGTYTIVSAAEWEEHRASGGAAVTLTPKQRVEKAEKRSKRAASAYDNAKIRKNSENSSRLDELKFIKAEAEFEIAEIELGKAEKALADSPPEDASDASEETEETEETDGVEETAISEEDLIEEEEEYEELR